MAALLTNTWYMGAWSHEVTETPMSRRLLGMATMFYRTSKGQIVAMRDRCPHRFAPLSLGKVTDDCIECPYHGLIFDASGQCIVSPMEERAPRAVRVQTFPVHERDNIVWFWTGEPERADPALIPDFSYHVSPRFKQVYGMTTVDAHYEIETDNLMDLTHSRTLHTAFGGSLGPDSEYSAGREGDSVYSRWHSKRVSNAPIFEYGMFPTGGEPIDQWLDTRWHAPGSMYLEVAVTRAGEPREAGAMLPSSHILTPASEHETHYFWAGAIGAEVPIDLDMFRQGFKFAFEDEDKPMLEHVARAMEGETDLLAMKPLLLRADAGAVLARRVLAELIAKEKAERLPATGAALPAAA